MKALPPIMLVTAVLVCMYMAASVQVPDLTFHEQPNNKVLVSCTLNNGCREEPWIKIGNVTAANLSYTCHSPAFVNYTGKCEELVGKNVTCSINDITQGCYFREDICSSITDHTSLPTNSKTPTATSLPTHESPLATSTPSPGDDASSSGMPAWAWAIIAVLVVVISIAAVVLLVIGYIYCEKLVSCWNHIWNRNHDRNQNYDLTQVVGDPGATVTVVTGGSRIPLRRTDVFTMGTARRRRDDDENDSSTQEGSTSEDEPRVHVAAGPHSTFSAQSEHNHHENTCMGSEEDDERRDDQITEEGEQEPAVTLL